MIQGDYTKYISLTSYTQCENCGTTDKKIWQCSRCIFKNFCIQCKKDHKLSHKILCKMENWLCPCFKTSEVDWKKIVKSQEKLDELFSLKVHHLDRTKARLQCLEVKSAISVLVSKLSGKHLRLLSDEQLLSPDFPWVEVANEKVNEIFSLKDPYFDRTKACLQDLEIKSAISVLVSKLSGEHLRLLSDEQLQSPNFPWKEVAKSQTMVTHLFERIYDKKRAKRRIRLLDVKSAICVLFPKLSGYQLRLLSNKQLQSPDFPWKDVAESKEKMKSLFSMDGTDSFKFRTVDILDLLDVKSTLRLLINKFDGDQFLYFSNTTWVSPDFPWDEIVKSDTKMKKIFCLGVRDFPFTKRFLQKLDVKLAIRVLFPKLSIDHLLLLSDKQFQSPDFPWDEVDKCKEKKKALYFKEKYYRRNI